MVRGVRGRCKGVGWWEERGGLRDGWRRLRRKGGRGESGGRLGT